MITTKASLKKIKVLTWVQLYPGQMILVVEGMFFSHVKLGVGELWGGGGIPQISNHLKQSLVPESTSWALLLTELSSGMNPLLGQITKLKCL